jgi:class 3 adenylate cyclase/tetratricopeptide (TPR) repeat protein
MLTRMTCPSCGTEVADGARYCWSCGQSLATTSDERRVVTVLFADLVGFTTMSETLDPEQVKRFVDRAFERLVADVVAFGGRVDKIIGDAIVALFGAPTAHEDDAERAVRAALRMQQTLATYAAETGMGVRMRIGVNSGEVLVGALRAGGDYTAMGDVVNTASRLQTSADPGSVLVGESTFASTKDVIVYESCGALVARGREQPVNVWVAKEALLPPGYRPRRSRSPLFGRESELSMLENAVSLSIRHQRSQLVLLLGDAGVGKSRLASEIAPLVRGQWPDAVVLNGRCVPYGEANPWWPIADALRNGIGLSLAEPLDRARAETVAVVARVLGADDPRVESVVNGVLHLMGYDGPLRGLDPGRARSEATGALMVAMEAWVRQQPVVIRIADLHWADDVVLELIDELSTQLARSAFVLVGTARRGLLGRWSPRAGPHNTLVLNLDPLDRSAADALVDSLAPAELPGHVRDMLLDRSGGNPLYLEELITLVGDGEQVSSVTDLELPDTLRGLIAARIDALAVDEQHTLEDAAVWGESGPLEALERLGQATRDAVGVAEVVERLEAKEVLNFDGDSWAFRSDLVREVAYARLTKLDRLKRHNGIAAYLDGVARGRFVDDAYVDILARHFSEAARLANELGADAHVPDDLTERALRWLGEAARRAERSAAWPLAERLHDQALGLSSASDPAELEHLLGRAVARKEMWKFDDARDDAARAWSLAERDDDEAQAAAALLVLGEVEARSGAPEVANRILSDAIQRFDQLADVKGRAEARRLMGMAAVFHQDYAAAEPSAFGALEDFRAVGDRRGEAWALQNLAWISFATGRIAEAEARLVDASDAFRDIGDVGGRSWTDGLMAFIRFFQGRTDDAYALAGEALREAERRADRWGQGMMLIVLAAVDLWRGHTARAEEMAQRSVALLRSLNDTVGLQQAIALRSRALLMQGRIAESRAAIDDTDNGTPGNGLTDLLGLSASVLVGNLDLARSKLDAVESPRDDLLSASPAEADTFVALSLLQLDRADEAEVFLDKAFAADQGSCFALSIRALLDATRGDRDDITAIVARLDEDERATYLDRSYARMAAALVSEEPAPILAELDAILAATGDELAKATAALAAANALRSTGGEAGRRASADAARRWAEIGVDPVGWRQLFARIADPTGSRPG